MEAGTAASGGSLGWRLWALVPLVLLALAVALVVSLGDRVVDLVGGSPPPADEFDVRRVEFREGEIRIQVRNPQRDDLTIASVTVDDAIVPFTLDGPATLERLRSSTIVIPYAWVEDDPIAVGVTSSTGIETVEEIPAARPHARSRAPRLPRVRADRRCSWASCPSRSACSGCRRCDAPTRAGSPRSWRSLPVC